MIAATISINKTHRLISAPLKERYQQRYPNHDVVIRLVEGSSPKPSLKLEKLATVPLGNSGSEDAAALPDREEREFMYQTFIRLFVELYGKYPWDMPR